MTLLTFLAQAFAERLPACLLGGTAIAVFASALLRIAGRNPGIRFLVWFSSLIGIALLLVFGAFQSGVNIGADGPTAAGQTPIVLPATWALYVFFAWAVFAGIALLRIGVGIWQIRKLRKSCTPLEISTLDPRIHESLKKLRSARPSSIYVSNRVGTPTAVGFFRPAVILPSWLIGDLSAMELNQVMLHEVAHLSRWDDWTNLAQKVLRALLFFHPLAWWIEKRISLEREMACDDIVLRETENPKAYARCLALLAEKSYARRGMALAQAAVSRFRQTSIRVSRILKIDIPVTTRAWKPVSSVAALLFFAGIVSQCYAPKFFVFEGATAAASSVKSEQIAAVGAGQAKPVESASGRSSTIPAVASTRSSSSRVPRTSAKSVTAVQSARPARVTSEPEQLASRDVRREGGDAGAEVIPAKATLQQPEHGMVSHAIFVVMESEQDHETGVTTWQVTVWRFVATPRNNPARNQITQRKI